MTNLSGGLIERLAADSCIEAVWLVEYAAALPRSMWSDCSEPDDGEEKYDAIPDIILQPHRRVRPVCFTGTRAIYDREFWRERR